MSIQGKLTAYKEFNLRTEIPEVLSRINEGIDGVVSAQVDTTAAVSETGQTVIGLFVEAATFPDVLISPGSFFNAVGQRFEYPGGVETLASTADLVQYLYINASYGLEAGTVVPANAKFVVAKVTNNSSANGFSSVESSSVVENPTYDGNGNMDSLTKSVFGLPLSQTLFTYVAGTDKFETVVHSSGPLQTVKTYSYNLGSSISSVALSKTLRVAETYTRTGTAYALNTGNSFSANTRRYDLVSGERGLLIEQARTNNMVGGSENFVTGWTPYLGATVVVTGGHPDPFGGNNAYRIQASGGTNIVKLLYSQFVPSAGVRGNTQVWARKYEVGSPNGTIVFNVGTPGVTAIQDVWTLHEGPTTGNGVSASQINFVAASVGGTLDVLAYRPAIFNNTTPNLLSWLPGAASAGGDQLSLSAPEVVHCLNAREGTVVIRAHLSSAVRDRSWGSVVNYLWQWAHASGAPHLSLAWYSSSGNFGFQFRSQGAGAASVQNHAVPLASAPAVGWHNIALSWHRGVNTIEYTLFVDGMLWATSSYPNYPEDSADLGAFRVGHTTAGFQANGHVQALLLFNQRQGQSALENLTKPGKLARAPGSSYFVQLA